MEIVTNLVIGQWLERFITWFLKDLTTLDWDQCSFTTQLNTDLVEVHLRKILVLKVYEIFDFFSKFLENFETEEIFENFFRILKYLPFHQHHWQIDPKQLNQPNYLSKCWNRFLVGQRHRNMLFGLSLRFRPKDFH